MSDYNAKRHREYLVNSYAFNEITFEYGNGSYLYDDRGNEYLDFTSGIGVNCLGHCNEKIVKAIKEQAEKLLHISNIYLNKNSIDLAEKLVKISGMKKVFFSNSGAESNEGAIKIARKYSYDKYGKERGTILTLNKSFHGRTMSTLMATGQEKFHKYFHPFPTGFKYFAANDIEAFKSTLDDTVCAIMLEAIQGEGGVNQLDSNFVKEITAICEEKDILLIFDEVQTGIGRTGKFLAHEYFDVKADIVTLAKGLGGGVPIGAILCGEKTENTIKYGDHGSTFGGNPLVTAVSNVIIDEFIENDFLAEINKKSKYIFNKLKDIKSDNIIEVRGRGLMVGIEVKGDIGLYVNKAIEQKLLILTAGGSTLRLLPPLNISYDEINKCIDVLGNIL
ncbi:aspartate aminotransferase family protein [uncultured Clostridium sp.]|jgi:acetylornithine/N-succinyldiaminopimelate aminotransferase|uniref:aspartate aminotransferase family protein n=1 Tax=uncultured Clostridium sp. TaxID=59620 RepID=UPI00261C8E00|nr:aspartate aminotransferase family protein [uncultured Clostridium sp.]